MKSTLFSIFFVILSCQLLAQSVSDCHKEGGAFISEIYNKGKADYIELTVYGSTANPTAPVNLEGWILDDNNTSKKDIGNQTGHIRLGSCFAAVNPGTIILIYTPTHYDPLNANPANDGFRDYEIQTSWKCLVPYLACPNKIGKNTGYDCEPTILAPTTSWDMKELIPLYNNADVLQLRNKEGELEHAIYWTADYDEKDNPKAVSVLEQITKLSTQYFTVNKWSIHFTADKDWLNTANFEVSGNSTLGTQNNTAHGNLIEKCKNGTFSTALKVTVAEKNKPTSKDNDGIIEVKIEGGQAKYKVSLSATDYNTWEFFDAQGTYTFDRLSSGNYSVLVEDGEFCPVFVDIVLEKTEAECQGTCKNIGFTASDYCRYEWVAHPDIVDVTLPQIKVCPFETTTYILKVMDKEGNVKELKYRVEVKEAFIDPSPILYCGGTKTITVQGVQPYWEHNGSVENSTEIDVIGTYKVQVTDVLGCRLNGKVEVLDANDPVAIKKYFEARGFNAVTENVRIEKVVGKPAPKGADRVAPCTQVFGNDKLFINDKYLSLEELTADICNYEPDFANSHLVTDNESFCKNGNLDAIEQAYAANDKAIWYHLWTYNGESILFYKSRKEYSSEKRTSVKNLKKIFTIYGTDKFKYKTIFVSEFKNVANYIVHETLKNNWFHCIVVVPETNLNNFNTARVQTYNSGIDRFNALIKDNIAYRMNDIFNFYNDVRPGECIDNSDPAHQFYIVKEKEKSRPIPCVESEMATPLFYIDEGFLVTSRDDIHRIVSKNPQNIDESDVVNIAKHFIGLTTPSGKPFLQAWVHKHPFHNYHYFKDKNDRNFYGPNYKSYIKISRNGKLDDVFYHVTPSPSPPDHEIYPTQNNALNVIIADNHIIFFNYTGVQAGKYFLIDRKGFDQ